MRVTVLACVSALAVSAPAYADDWTGFYAGIHAGIGASSHDVSGQGAGLGYSYTFDYALEPESGVAGGQIGYLHQFGQFVVGVEAAASYVDFAEAIGPFSGTGINFDYAGFDAEWIASLRARAGVAVGRGVLLTASGGIAFSSWRETAGASGGDFDPVETDRTGWVAGVGVAFDLGGGWFGAIDYAHYGFGDETRPGWLDDGNLTAETEIRVLTLGLNYRF